MSSLRHIGGKSRGHNLVYNTLVKLINNRIVEYREPFAGGLGMLFRLAKDYTLGGIWANDKNPFTLSYWNDVKHYSPQLISNINEFKPNKKMFELWKDELLKMQRNTDLNYSEGFKRLAVNRMSFNGMGELATAMTEIGKNFNAKSIIDEVKKESHILNTVPSIFTGIDFEHLITSPKMSYPVVIYLDPVYFTMGNDLYNVKMDTKDHMRLEHALKYCEHDWVMSYDESEVIRELYSWANVKQSINTVNQKKELVITPKVKKVHVINKKEIVKAPKVKFKLTFETMSAISSLVLKGYSKVKATKEVKLAYEKIQKNECGLLVKHVLLKK